jgi:hypothetical protein
MIAWLAGVGLVLAGFAILFGAAEVGMLLGQRHNQRALDGLSEGDARLRNELARLHDQLNT